MMGMDWVMVGIDFGSHHEDCYQLQSMGVDRQREQQTLFQRRSKKSKDLS